MSRAVEWVSPGDLAERRASIRGALEQWRNDWESLDTERYLSHYSESFRGDQLDRAGFAARKRRANDAKTSIRVGLDDVGIYGYPGEHELVLVEFLQRLEGSDSRSAGRKRQHWRREKGRWKIVYEGGA